MVGQCRSRMRKLITAATAAGLVALASSCGRTEEIRSSEAPRSRTGEPVLHAVNSARLPELMGEISRLAGRADYVGAMKLEERQTESVRVASALEKSATELQSRAAEIDLSESERELFVALAVKLGEHAKKFGHASRSNDFEGMKVALSSMAATCDDCHALFRGTAP